MLLIAEKIIIILCRLQRREIKYNMTIYQQEIMLDKIIANIILYFNAQ